MRALIFHHVGLRVLRLAFMPAASLAPAACSAETPVESPAASMAKAPRCVRVLIAETTDPVRLRAETPLHPLAIGGGPLNEILTTEWTQCQADAGGGLSLGTRRLAVDQIEFPGWAAAAGKLSRRTRDGWEPAIALPGRLLIRRGPRGLTIINEVEIEEYVAGVTAREIPSDFHVEAFRAQSILCRTFCLDQMRSRDNLSYDVLASEGSQVYVGTVAGAAGEKARAAAAETAGLVCTGPRDGKEDIFPTYYSSACGGSSQSAWTFNPSDRIEALSGDVACDFCSIAPPECYRWGPVTLPEESVRAAILERYPRLTSLDRLKTIEATRQAPSGRLLEIRLTDAKGAQWTLPAEHVRLAIGSRVMRSTDCRMSLAAGEVRLENGKGFGHGLGLCQWGMQGQALAGRTAPQILRYYFPGSSLTRVY